MNLKIIVSIVLALIFLIIYQFIFLWIDSINERSLMLTERLIVAIISCILWPAIIVLMRRLFFGGKKQPSI